MLFRALVCFYTVSIVNTQNESESRRCGRDKIMNGYMNRKQITGYQNYCMRDNEEGEKKGKEKPET